MVARVAEDGASAKPKCPADWLCRRNAPSKAVEIKTGNISAEFSKSPHSVLQDLCSSKSY